MLDKTSAAFPVLLRVTDWAVLGVPTATFAKVRLEADNETAGAVGGGGVLALPPPQAATNSAAAMAASKRLGAADEPYLRVIAPPPRRHCWERDWARRRVPSKTACDRR